MGLDITAYRQLVPAPDVGEEQADEDYLKYFRPGPSLAWSEQHWPGRGEGIDANTTYTFAERFPFRAGSYSGYGEWRRLLSKLAGYATIEDAWEQLDPAKPFNELIHFADNEGVIGPVVGAKLAKDFADHEARAFETMPDWFCRSYGHWKRAFEMAADGGAVDFH